MTSLLTAQEAAKQTYANLSAKYATAISEAILRGSYYVYVNAEKHVCDNDLVVAMLEKKGYEVTRRYGEDKIKIEWGHMRVED